MVEQAYKEIGIDYSMLKQMPLPKQSAEQNTTPEKPASDITPEKLKAINFLIRQNLMAQGIPVLKLDVSMLVKKNFYDSIKANFPDRHPADMVVNAGEKDWTMQIQYSLY